MRPPELKARIERGRYGWWTMVPMDPAGHTHKSRCYATFESAQSYVWQWVALYGITTTR